MLLISKEDVSKASDQGLNFQKSFSGFFLILVRHWELNFFCSISSNMHCKIN